MRYIESHRKTLQGAATLSGGAMLILTRVLIFILIAKVIVIIFWNGLLKSLQNK